MDAPAADVEHTSRGVLAKPVTLPSTESEERRIHPSAQDQLVVFPENGRMTQCNNLNNNTVPTPTNAVASLILPWNTGKRGVNTMKGEHRSLSTDMTSGTQRAHKENTWMTEESRPSIRAQQHNHTGCILKTSHSINTHNRISAFHLMIVLKVQKSNVPHSLILVVPSQQTAGVLQLPLQLLSTASPLSSVWPHEQLTHFSLRWAGLVVYEQEPGNNFLGNCHILTV